MRRICTAFARGDPQLGSVPALDQSVCDAVRRVTGITPLRVGPGILHRTEYPH